MKTNSFNTNIRLGLAMLATAGLLTVSSVSANARVADDRKTETSAKSAVSIREVGNLKFKVAVSEPTDQRVDVMIVDGETNNTLYAGTLSKKEQGSRVFDLSQLVDGTYVINVFYGKEKVSQSFTIQTQVNRVVLARN
jgi:protein-disulfide isomerase